MAEMLINQWEWMWSDEYLQSWNELFDCRDIDFSSSRRIRSNGAYARWWDPIRTATSQYWLYKYTKNTYTHVLSYWDDAKIWDWTTLRWIWYGSRTHVTVWVWNWTYNETTASSEMRHFFFPYNSARIVYTNYNWSSIATIDTSAIPRLNDASLYPWASCYIWRGAILFSYWNWIHAVNPSPNTPVYLSEKVTLPEWANVKNISYMNGLIWFIYTITGKNSTFIQWCSFDWTNYKLNTYVTEVSWQVCIWATSDSWMIYWVSEWEINEFNWAQNSVIKSLYERSWTQDYFYSSSWWSECVCSFNEWFLKIVAPNKIYSYWNKRAWYKKNLTELKLDTWYQALALVNDWYAIIHDSWNHRISWVDSKYNASSYVITMPYTAWRYSSIKEWLWIRVWYSLKKSSWGSIKISIITDSMIRNYWFENYSNYIEIANISDYTKTYLDITPNTIALALGNSSYSNEFSLIKIKIELINGWQNFYADWSVRYSNTPEVFDLYYYHEEVK